MQIKNLKRLITNEPGVILSTFYADCVPLYFVDPVNKAIGLSHSGWRGTVGRIGQKTLEAMKEAYGTNPEDIYAAVGPSICQECYEISEDVFPAYTLKTTNVGGPSGGLLQTLAIYNSLVDEDITRGLKIAGTGTIDANGKVGKIGGIKQKIHTANDDNMDIFLCPEENYDEALIAYNSLKNPKMKLYMVKTLDDALEVLRNA